MQAELSRRAAQIMKTPAYFALPEGDRIAFVSAVEAATSFAALAARWRMVITTGEDQVKKHILYPPDLLIEKYP